MDAMWVKGPPYVYLSDVVLWFNLLELGSSEPNCDIYALSMIDV